MSPFEVALPVGVALAAGITVAIRACGTRLGLERRTAEKVGLVLGGVAGFGAAVALALGLQKPRWRPFASTEGAFAVELPCEPEQRTQDETTPLGTVTSHVVEARPTFTTWAYGVSWCDRRDDAVVREPKKVLEAIERGMVEKLHATIVGESELTLDGHPGRAFELSAARRRAAQRVFVVGSRVYLVCVDAPEEDLPATDRFRHFLDSFHLAHP